MTKTFRIDTPKGDIDDCGNTSKEYRSAHPFRPEADHTLHFFKDGEKVDSTTLLSQGLKAAVQALGITHLTKLQTDLLKLYSENGALVDFDVRSPVGSGKSFAISLILVEHALKLRSGDPTKDGGVKIILFCPTRLLAEQYHQDIWSLGHRLGIFVELGADINGHLKKYNQDAIQCSKCDILIVTNGRILNLLIDDTSEPIDRVIHHTIDYEVADEQKRHNALIAFKELIGGSNSMFSDTTLLVFDEMGTSFHPDGGAEEMEGILRILIGRMPTRFGTWFIASDDFKEQPGPLKAYLLDRHGQALPIVTIKPVGEGSWPLANLDVTLRAIYLKPDFDDYAKPARMVLQQLNKMVNTGNTASGKTLVLVGSIQKGKTIQSFFQETHAINVPFLHSKMDKNMLLPTIDAFMRGEHRILVATPRMVIGLNLGATRVILAFWDGGYGYDPVHNFRAMSHTARMGRVDTVDMLFSRMKNDVQSLLKLDYFFRKWEKHAGIMEQAFDDFVAGEREHCQHLEHIDDPFDMASLTDITDAAAIADIYPATAKRLQLSPGNDNDNDNEYNGIQDLHDASPVVDPTHNAMATAHNVTPPFYNATAPTVTITNTEQTDARVAEPEAVNVNTAMAEELARETLGITPDMLA